MEAETPEGVITVHDFSSTDGWHVIEDFRKPGLYSLDPSQSAAAGQFNVTSRFSWASGGLALVGIRAGGADEPIPALVSSEFLETTDAKVGDTIVLGLSTYALPLEIAAELEFFPTLDPEDKPFAVVDLSRFSQAAMRYNPRPPRGPNELWLAGDGSPSTLDQGWAESMTAAMRQEGVSVRNVMHGPNHGGLAGRAAFGERRLGGAAGAAVPCGRIGQRFRSAAFLSPGLQGKTDRVRIAANPGNLPRADAAYIVGQPTLDGRLWRRAGNAARLAHRRQRASPDGSCRRRCARYTIPGAHYRLAALAGILRYPGRGNRPLWPLADLVDWQSCSCNRYSEWENNTPHHPLSLEGEG